MKRTRNTPKPLAILTADWHLREDKPVCRMDDFWAAQWEKVDFIKDLQERYDCPVVHAGDLYHHWKPSPYLLSETIEHLPKQFYTVYGQHDLPQHNLDLAFKCGINTLEAAEALTILPACHWGMSPDKLGVWWEVAGHKILVWHYLVIERGDILRGFVDHSELPVKILRRLEEYKLIVTGDNHKSFCEEFQGRFLVNPGSLTRQAADQINHIPCVWLWYGDGVEQIFLPSERDVISRDHIEVQEQRDKRIDAFVSRLDGDWNVGMSFEQNLEEFFKVNQIRDSVKQIIYKAIE